MGRVLPEDQTIVLQALTVIENKRVETSRNSRIRRNQSLAQQLVYTPPNLYHSAVYFDMAVTPLLLDALVPLEARQISIGNSWDATVFVAENPWEPTLLVKLVATLKGGILCVPNVLQGLQGPVRVLKTGLLTKRKLFVSDEFRNRLQQTWLIMRLLIDRPGHRCKIIDSPPVYATEKLKAMRAGRSAEVLALVTDEETAVNRLAHVFNLEGLLAFLKRDCAEETCLGLGKL